MKTKACVTGPEDTTLDKLVAAFSSPEFTKAVLHEITRDIFGVEDVDERPAEYYVQSADRGHALGKTYGIEIRMTGISRDGRTPKRFHEALAKLEQIAGNTAFYATSGSNPRIQIFCVLMLDGQIEVVAGSGEYSEVIEGEAFVLRGSAES